MMFRNFNITITFIFICFVFQTIGQEHLSDIIFDIENDLSSKNGICGLSLIELDSRVEIASLNGEISFIPASSLKLLTSFVALDVLGKDFQYSTKITYDGQILSDGTLNGNIYIEGSGDPTLGTVRINGTIGFNSLLAHLTREISDFGISCIDGEIVADGSIFESFPVCPSWQWNDIGNYYGSGSWGINVHENFYSIYFADREEVGINPRIRTHFPFIPGISFLNEVITDKPGTSDNAYIYGGPYEYHKRIVGTIPAGKGEFIIKGSIPDPPLFFAYHFASTLKKSGIQNSGYKTQIKAEGDIKKRKIITEVLSPILDEIVKSANFHSINLYSESLLKTIGIKLGRIGNSQTGIRELINYLKKKGLDVSSLHMEDGSGLSSRNLTSANLLAELLALYARTMGREVAISLLPQAGKEGTMKNMFRKSPAKAGIWAKSGSMERVQSFSGYIKGKSGKYYSFSIICNNFAIRNAEMRKMIDLYISRIYAVI